jgi:hypothetical protein
MLVLALLLGSPAHALTQAQQGPYVELGVGGGGAGSGPVQGAVGGHLSTGLWAGKYDEAYAFGRYWSVGVTAEGVYLPASGQVRLSPMVELRRGIDVLVANPAPFLAVGPALVVDDEVAAGVAARGGLALKWRKSRFWGVTFRLQGGVDAVQGSLSPAFGLMVGGGFARPARTMNKLDKRK